MKIAAAYIRVSTEEQTELSPDSQIKQIREYAKAHDYIVPDEYIFRDDGISGRTTAKRPEFNRMIATAKQKPTPFEAILLWKFSRFARNREDSIVYKSMLKKIGIDVISISEPIGDDKMSVILEAMLEAMDEYYSINLSEEVRRGMLESLSRGNCVTSPPYGYTKKDRLFIIDEEQAAIVRRIYYDFINGKDRLTITRELNAEGIRTRTGKLFDKRNISYILNNPVYKGYIRYTPGAKAGPTAYKKYQDKTLTFKGIHEPIIPPEIWNKANERLIKLTAQYKKNRPEAAQKHELMLRGLLKCSTCGAAMVYTSKGYQCGNYVRGKCSVSHYIRENKINEAVVNALRTLNVGNCEIVPVHRSEYLPPDNTDKLIQQAKAKLRRIKEAYEAGIDTLAEYKANKEKITTEIERLTAQKPKPQSPTPKPDLEAKRIDFIKLFDTQAYTQQQLNSILCDFINKIVYNKQREQITIYLSAEL